MGASSAERFRAAIAARIRSALRQGRERPRRAVSRPRTCDAKRKPSQRQVIDVPRGRHQPAHMRIFSTLSGLLLLSVVTLGIEPARAMSLRRACRLHCRDAISACVTAGETHRRCRRDILRLCRHAGLAACPGGVSPTTTTTLASGPCDFNTSARRCEGTCADGGHCSAVASGGACECRTTACGDASQPECNGFCNPDEACIFLVTGCSCTSIP